MGSLMNIVHTMVSQISASASQSSMRSIFFAPFVRDVLDYFSRIVIGVISPSKMDELYSLERLAEILNLKNVTSMQSFIESDYMKNKPIVDSTHSRLQAMDAEYKGKMLKYGDVTIKLADKDLHVHQMKLRQRDPEWLREWTDHYEQMRVHVIE